MAGLMARLRNSLPWDRLITLGQRQALPVSCVCVKLANKPLAHLTGKFKRLKNVQVWVMFLLFNLINLKSVFARGKTTLMGRKHVQSDNYSTKNLKNTEKYGNFVI